MNYAVQSNECRDSPMMALGFSSKMVRFFPSSFIPSMLPVVTALQPIMISRGSQGWWLMITPVFFPNMTHYLKYHCDHHRIQLVHHIPKHRTRKIHEQSRQTLSAVRLAPNISMNTFPSQGPRSPWTVFNVTVFFPLPLPYSPVKKFALLQKQLTLPSFI
jgi:hypothetical protein